MSEEAARGAELLRNKTAGISFLNCSVNFLGRITATAVFRSSYGTKDGTAVAIAERLESIHLTF